jgi:hypothetical protein
MTRHGFILGLRGCVTWARLYLGVERLHDLGTVFFFLGIERLRDLGMALSGSRKVT